MSSNPSISEGYPFLIVFNLKKGEFGPLGVKVRRLETALTGQMGELRILGTVINLIWLLFFMVLDHLTSIIILPGLNIISALARCFKGEKVATLCGTRFDIRKNEKKLSK